jgi:hypothetical protein
MSKISSPLRDHTFENSVWKPPKIQTGLSIYNILFIWLKRNSFGRLLKRHSSLHNYSSRAPAIHLIGTIKNFEGEHLGEYFHNVMLRGNALVSK